MRILLAFIYLFILLGNVSAYEKADAFIVRIFDKRVKVLSPKKWDPRLNVIIENKTLVQVLGQIVTAEGKVLSQLSIPPGKFQSVELKTKKGEKIFFIPLTPPSQKVELKLGNRPYEIPPKK